MTAVDPGRAPGSWLVCAALEEIIWGAVRKSTSEGAKRARARLECAQDYQELRWTDSFIPSECGADGDRAARAVKGNGGAEVASTGARRQDAQRGR